MSVTTKCQSLCLALFGLLSVCTAHREDQVGGGTGVQRAPDNTRARGVYCGGYGRRSQSPPKAGEVDLEQVVRPEVAPKEQIHVPGLKIVISDSDFEKDEKSFEEAQKEISSLKSQIVTLEDLIARLKKDSRRMHFFGQKSNLQAWFNGLNFIIHGDPYRTAEGRTSKHKDYKRCECHRLSWPRNGERFPQFDPIYPEGDKVEMIKRQSGDKALKGIWRYENMVFWTCNLREEMTKFYDAIIQEKTSALAAIGNSMDAHTVTARKRAEFDLYAAKRRKWTAEGKYLTCSVQYRRLCHLPAIYTSYRTFQRVTKLLFDHGRKDENVWDVVFEMWKTDPAELQRFLGLGEEEEKPSLSGYWEHTSGSIIHAPKSEAPKPWSRVPSTEGQEAFWQHTDGTKNYGDTPPGWTYCVEGEYA